jgi:hypothetical protein
MPKSITDFQPKGLRLDHRFYSDDDIDAIIAAAGQLPDGEVAHEVPVDDPNGFHHITIRVPRRRALSERLEQATHAYTVFREFQTKATAKRVTDAMADIEAAAAKLINALHLPKIMDRDPIAPIPLGLRARAWVSSEVDSWIQERIQRPREVAPSPRSRRARRAPAEPSVT